jgi:phage-related protein
MVHPTNQIVAKRLIAEFYISENGEMPCRKYLTALSETDRKIVGTDIATVEFGWPIGMPVCKAVGNQGVKEVRSTIRDGKVEARVLFGIDSNRMILLHGFDKKPARQDDEIKLGEQRWQNYLDRQKRLSKAKKK